MPTVLDPITDYADDVIAGEIPACQWVRLACERHVTDLEDPRFTWDPEEAMAHVRFFEQLRHYKGEHAGTQFTLEPWQVFIVGSLYGWRWERDGTLRYRYAYNEVPRKNGKTALSAGIGLIGLMRESGAEVYSVATKEDQARLSWNDGVTFVKQSRPLAQRLRLRTKVIHYDENHALWRPLGSDSNTQDGLNPSTVIIDELHAWKTRELYDTVDDAQGARLEPLMFMITTAGYNQSGICYETRNHATDVLMGTVQDDTFFAIIFTVDDPEKWHDEDEWRKANPNIGISKTWAYMRDQAQRARNSISKRNAFMNKQLNIWTNAATAFLAQEDWDACLAGDLQLGQLAAERVLAYGGLDLSQKIDLTAFALYFPAVHALKVHFWMPEATLHRRTQEDRVPYNEWAEQGWITVTEGNAVDYDRVEADVKELLRQFHILEIGYDPWNATQTAIRLAAEGVMMSEVRQGMASLSAPTKELERLVVSKELRHEGNPVLDWMMYNVAVRVDENDNKRPIKPDGRSRFRIDGVTATVMAMARALESEGEPEAEPEPMIRVIR